MKQLLAISWAMPPLVFPRAIQVARLLHHLRPAGWASTVVCVDDRSLARSRPRDAGLATRYAGSYERLPVPSAEDAFLLRVLARLSAAWRSRPDPRRVWIRPAARAGVARARARRHDVLASFAQPWSDHLAALRVKAATGLPWVAHFSDPWVDSPYFQVPPASRRWARAAEAAVVAQADRLIFLTDETRDLVMQKYNPDLTRKARVLPHGFDPPAGPLTGAPPPDGPLRVVHTGNLYEGRTPLGLLRALENLRRSAGGHHAVEVELVGFADPSLEQAVRSAGLEGTIRLEGPRGYEVAADMARCADVLLVVDAPGRENVFLPSKLIEYLAYGRPILGLTPLRGASARLLGALGCDVVSPDDVAGIELALRRLGERKASGTLTVGPAFHRVAADYHAGRVAMRFAGILDEIVADRACEEPVACS